MKKSNFIAIIVCFVVLVSSLLGLTAFADETHTHDFSKGACSCGAILLEAEDADIVGTPTYGNPGFVETNAADHGTGHVGNWGNGDNVITFTFNSTATNNAKITVHAAPCANSSLPGPGGSIDSSAFLMYINSNNWHDSVTYQEAYSLSFDGEHWYNYQDFVATGITLVEGENKVKIEANGGVPLNFDYIIVEASPATEPEQPTVEYTKYTVLEGKTRFEAEDAKFGDVEGAENPITVEEKPDKGLSGDKGVGYFQDAGKSLTFIFASKYAGKATVSFGMGSGSWPSSGDNSFRAVSMTADEVNTALTFEINGKAVTVAGEDLPAGTEQWFAYNIGIMTAEMDVVAGDNVIVVTSTGVAPVNFDYIELDKDITKGSSSEPENQFVDGRNPLTGEMLAGTDSTHVHKFENGKCATCGSILVEAESGELIGTYYDDPMISGDDTANGDAFILGSWGSKGDNILKITFSSETAYTAKLAVRLQNVSASLIYVYTQTDVDMYEGEAYNNGMAITHLPSVSDSWGYLTTDEFEVVEGDNAIYMECQEGHKFAIDCFIIESGIKHNHNFVDDKCACGAVLLEAENMKMEGTPTYDNPSFLNERSESHGGAEINNWGNGDNLMHIKFYSDRETTAQIAVVVADCSGSAFDLRSTTGNDKGSDGLLMKNYANEGSDEYIGWAQGHVDANDGSYHNYCTIVSVEVPVVAGENHFVLEANNNRGLNFDYIVIQNVGGAIITAQPTYHTHNLNRKGYCTECGKYVIELEDAQLVGNEGLEPQIGTHATDSNGKHVGNWGDGSNQIIANFYASEADDNATITIRVAPCASGEYIPGPECNIENGCFLLYVNSDNWHDSLTFSEEMTMEFDGSNYYAWNDLTITGVKLVKGLNKIIVEANNLKPLNFDFLTIDSEASLSAEEVHVHSYNNKGVCECGATKIECESGVKAELAMYQISESDSASGGAYISDWGDGNDVVSFYFNASKACDNVVITVYTVQCSRTGTYIPIESEPQENYNPYWAFLFRVNGLHYGFEDISEITWGPDDGWEAFAPLYSFPVSLKAGENCIEIEACGFTAFNFDYIVVGVPSDVTIDFVAKDVIAPTVDVTVPANAEVGSEINVTVNATDNETETSKLKITVEAVYNYKRPNSKTIEVKNGKFTATDAGTYTILVTVEDESGNKTTKTASIVVNGGASETHTCNHVCPICGKCTDASCLDDACKSKCQGHATEEPGCFGVIGASSVVALATIITAVVVLRKKED